MISFNRSLPWPKTDTVHHEYSMKGLWDLTINLRDSYISVNFVYIVAWRFISADVFISLFVGLREMWWNFVGGLSMPQKSIDCILVVTEWVSGSRMKLKYASPLQILLEMDLQLTCSPLRFILSPLRGWYIWALIEACALWELLAVCIFICLAIH